MDLHQALDNDWSSVAPANRTALQQLAAKTNGILTAGNAISVGGLALVVIGAVCLAANKYWLGASLIIIGRLADLADGFIAQLTATKSPLGEAVDATVDKLEAAAVIVILFTAGILPIYLVVAVFVHSAFGTILYWLADRKKGRIHPGHAGKIATAFEWFALVATASSEHYTNLQPLALILSLCFITLGVLAAWQYIQQYQRLDKNNV